MVLLRSIPELSTIYSTAIDFLGDAMNCKGSSSLLDTINCIDSSAWCDSRDEQEEVVVESSLSSSLSSLSLSNKFANNNNNSNTDRGFEEDLSSRSLSSSVHQLLYDSSERQSQHTKTDSMTMPTLVRQSEDDTIFRSRVEEPTQEAASSSSSNKNSSQCLQFYKLNRCTAWSQDEAGCYSFESERDQHNHSMTATEEPKKRSNVRMVHWDEVVHDSLNTNTNTNNTNKNEDNTNIFRADSHCLNSLCKLDRCAAWSIDESSSMVDSRLRSNPIQELSSHQSQQQGDNDNNNNNNNNNNNEAKLVHWDELADKCLITHTH